MQKQYTHFASSHLKLIYIYNFPYCLKKGKKKTELFQAAIQINFCFLQLSFSPFLFFLTCAYDFSNTFFWFLTSKPLFFDIIFSNESYNFYLVFFFYLLDGFHTKLNPPYLEDTRIQSHRRKKYRLSLIQHHWLLKTIEVFFFPSAKNRLSKYLFHVISSI